MTFSHSSKNTVLYQTFPALDGLRGVSILLVVFGHLPIALPKWLIPLAIRGDLGVELFFAISGFLVTRSLFQCVDHHLSPLSVTRDFMLRRVSRIFPPYFMSLLLLFLIAIFLDPNLFRKISEIKSILWVFPTFLSNYFMPYHRVDVAPLGITWSLAFEEQFYLLIIGLFLVFGLKRLPALILGCGLFSVFARFHYVSVHPGLDLKSHLQMILHLRFDAIAWGCLSWIYYDSFTFLWKNQWRAFFTNTFIVVGIVFIFIVHRYYPYDFMWTARVYILTGPFFALAVRALTEKKQEVRLGVKIFSHPLLATLGIISYEIYLLHQIVLPSLVKTGLNQYAFPYACSALVLSISGAWIFHRFFSLRVQKFIKKATTAQLAR